MIGHSDPDSVLEISLFLSLGPNLMSTHQPEALTGLLLPLNTEQMTVTLLPCDAYGDKARGFQHDCPKGQGMTKVK